MTALFNESKASGDSHGEELFDLLLDALRFDFDK